MAALMEGSGHWIWDRDVGFHEYVQKELGHLGGAAAQVLDAVGREPEEQIFRREEDGRICLRVLNKLHSKEGQVCHLDPSGATHEGDFDLPVHGHVKGSMRSQLEEDSLNTYTSASHGGSGGAEEKFQLNILRQVRDGEYHMTLDNVSSGNKCTRIFRRFPHYKIQNETGHTVTLSTYNAGDMVRLVSAMTTQIPVGTHCVDASGGMTEEKQAVFSLPDGRKYSGFNLRPFETYILKSENFQ